MYSISFPDTHLCILVWDVESGTIALSPLAMSGYVRKHQTPRAKTLRFQIESASAD
jgi:hypothetical protein